MTGSAPKRWDVVFRVASWKDETFFLCSFLSLVSDRGRTGGRRITGSEGYEVSERTVSMERQRYSQRRV